jgi:hypothetical protein
MQGDWIALPGNCRYSMAPLQRMTNHRLTQMPRGSENE